MLDERSFWDRVTNLVGVTVYTLKRNRGNKIIKVTDSHVEIEGRVSKISRRGETGIYENYCKLHRDGYLLIGEGGNGYGYYVIMPIILKAIPNEVEEGYRGLKLI